MKYMILLLILMGCGCNVVEDNLPELSKNEDHIMEDCSTTRNPNYCLDHQY